MLAAGDRQDPDPNALDSAPNLEILLRRLGTEHAEDLVRDGSGNISSVVLRQGWVNDTNVGMISNLDSLQRLAMVLSRRTELTARGMDSLARLTNLVALELDCSGPLTNGLFRATCNLKHLRELRLYGAYPSEGEYNCITNLTGLSDLHLIYCSNFRDPQLQILTHLPRLGRLELRADGLSPGATNVFRSIRTLTNVVFDGGRR